MTDGYVELKDKIFIVKKGTNIGYYFMNYSIKNCLFILNGDINFAAGHWDITYSVFQGVPWTDFKKRWALVNEAEKEGKVISSLDKESFLSEEERDFYETYANIASRGW